MSERRRPSTICLRLPSGVTTAPDRKITPRRDAVELGDAIDLPPPQAKTA